MIDGNLDQWISLVSLAVPVLIWLVVAVVTRRVFAQLGLRSAFGLGGSLVGRLFPQWRWVVRVALSLFVGLMIATAIGAIFPRTILPAASLLCDGAVELHSQGYSYKPGQHGVSHAISCTQADGRSESITLTTIGVAWLGYSAVVFALLSLWHLLGSAIARKGGDARDFSMPGVGASPSAPSGSTFVGVRSGAAGKPQVFTSTHTTVSVNDELKLQSLAGLGDALRQTMGGKMADLIEEAIEQARHRPNDGKPIIIDGGARITQNGGQDAASRLRTLQALREQGLVSSAEYEAKRAAILSEL